MNAAINNVLMRKNDIVNKTMEYQNNIHDNENDGTFSFEYSYEDYTPYFELCDFFDKNFKDDEIMVILSIMYFGRECFIHDNYICGKSIEEIISFWMEQLSFSFGKSIEKDILIRQMAEKGLRIGTYFKCGFENLR